MMLQQKPMNIAEILRMAADRIEAHGWWDGSPGSASGGFCAMTAVCATPGVGWTRVLSYMDRRVRDMGYVNNCGDSEMWAKPATAVWNDAHDKDYVVKQMRAWADEWEQEHA